MPKTYLGDGLYADFDGYHVVLTAENGIRATNTVYLDPQVLQAFSEYLKSLREAFENKLKAV
jgi:hypothetical protein